MDLPAFKAGSRHYQDIALTPERQVLNIDAYLNGKESTQANITHYKVSEVDEHAAEVPAGDYFAEPGIGMYYISIDPRGELAWETNMFGYGGVINWSFVQNGLVDEVSMVLAPIANGDPQARPFYHG